MLGAAVSLGRLAREEGVQNREDDTEGFAQDEQE